MIAAHPPPSARLKRLLVMSDISHFDIHYLSQQKKTYFTTIKGGPIRYYIKANGFATDDIESKDALLLKGVSRDLSLRVRNQIWLTATKCKSVQYTASTDAGDLKT